MAKVTLDYSKTEKFIRQDEVKAFARIAEAAKEVLVSRTGEGNDFLGWIDLPTDYDKEEFAGSKKRQRRFRVIQKCFW